MFCLLQNIPRSTSITHPLYPLLAEMVVAAKLDVPFSDILNKLYPPRANRNWSLAYATSLTCILKSTPNAALVAGCIGDKFLSNVVFVFQENKWNRRPDELFDKTMSTFFAALADALKSDSVSSETRFDVVEKLLLNSGVLQFDTVTKSRYVYNLCFFFKYMLAKMMLWEFKTPTT